MANKKPKVIISSASLLAFISTSFMVGSSFAADSATNFEVNVKEVLSVSVTEPTTWASGNIDTFLRNKVNVSVTTNNAAGFTATMSSKTTNTSLTNTSNNSYTLPTLSASSVRSSFPANYWGYSLDDTESGSDSSTYQAMVASNATPITLLSSDTATSGSKDFYFGAKGNSALAAGTYAGTVVINVVSGVIDSSTNPVTPVNPATPGSSDEVAVYNSTTGGSASGTTTYTYRRTSSGNTTTTTEVTDGDNVSLYDGYTPPQGVISNTLSNISSTSMLATGLALAATVAATSGMFLIIAARTEGDDDEEDQPQLQ